MSIVAAGRERSDEERLKLRFAGSLVEQLGKQLYPSATATVAELISNAWDADATHVWVTIPLDRPWATGDIVTVLDDGSGMSYQDARDAYLIVGRKRRLTAGLKSPGGRVVHGRKGIGKLAAFGTAAILECTSWSGVQPPVAFELHYDEIRKLTPSEDYSVPVIPSPAALFHGESGAELKTGTRIRLLGLLTKRPLQSDQFLLSMSRRFAIDAGDMEVVINGTKLERFSMPLEFQFPMDALPPGAHLESDGWALEHLRGGEAVRWWIGFTPTPLSDEGQQGISVLANKKMAQRPFKFARSRGTTGQLGQEYLVGEVEADWIDVGVDVEDDLIQSNRDQLQLEDERLASFLEWGEKRLDWALGKRNALKSAKLAKQFEEDAALSELLQDMNATDRNMYLKIGMVLSRNPEIDAADVQEVVRAVVDASSDVQVRRLMEEIAQQDESVQQGMWELVKKFGLIDARRVYSIIEARLATISKLRRAVQDGASEVPDLHQIVRRDSWLLDPRWHLMGHEINVLEVNPGWSPVLNEEGERLDYLFALAPTPPAPMDEVVVVEIKRGTDSRGVEHAADEPEVQKFHSYVLGVKEYYERSTDRPRVVGLMIAQRYTHRADLIRRSLETTQDVKLEFRTWSRVLEDTSRMHEGWLKVSGDRRDTP